MDTATFNLIVTLIGTVGVVLIIGAFFANKSNRESLEIVLIFLGFGMMSTSAAMFFSNAWWLLGTFVGLLVIAALYRISITEAFLNHLELNKPAALAAPRYARGLHENKNKLTHEEIRAARLPLGPPA